MRRSDEDLLAAAAAGQAEAFDELAARWGPRIAAYLRATLGDDAWAEDLTQDVFVKAYCNLRTRDTARSFAVWLFRIARNEAIDFLRRRSVHRRLLDACASGVGPLARTIQGRRAPSPDGELQVAELRERLEEGLARLSEAHRTVFLLREREGLSYEEIGEVVGCSAPTVSTRLARARKRLRELLRGRLAADVEGGALE